MGRTGVPTIVVKYRSSDGYSKSARFKTLAGAQKFAWKWVGRHPDIGSWYAVSDDGVGRIAADGATMAKLFPEGEGREGERGRGNDGLRAKGSRKRSAPGRGKPYLPTTGAAGTAAPSIPPWKPRPSTDIMRHWERWFTIGGRKWRGSIDQIEARPREVRWHLTRVVSAGEGGPTPGTHGVAASPFEAGAAVQAAAATAIVEAAAASAPQGYDDVVNPFRRSWPKRPSWLQRLFGMRAMTPQGKPHASIRAKTYRGVAGFLIVGRDEEGRPLSVFTPHRDRAERNRNFMRL